MTKSAAEKDLLRRVDHWSSMWAEARDEAKALRLERDRAVSALEEAQLVLRDLLQDVRGVLARGEAGQ